MKRPNYEIVLRALESGLEVEIDGYVYGIQGLLLCTKVVRCISGSDIVEEEVWLSSDMSVSRFITECEALSEKTITILIMNMTLNKNKL